MSDLKHAELMLKMAQKDIALLELLITDETVDIEIFGFHAQQSVEKTLKALLSYSGQKYSRTHDLEALYAMLEDEIQKRISEFSLLWELTDFAVDFRYEPFESMGVKLDKIRVLDQTKSLYQFVRKTLAANS